MIDPDRGTGTPRAWERQNQETRRWGPELSHLFNSGSNHITGYNALKKLPKPMLETLRWMGFHFDSKFDPKNGAKGKIPVSPDEWSRVGINKDARAMTLLRFLYRMQFSQIFRFYFDTKFRIIQIDSA